MEREEIEENNTNDIQALEARMYALWNTVQKPQSESFDQVSATVEDRIEHLRR
jgi:hypothetical protein